MAEASSCPEVPQPPLPAVPSSLSTSPAVGAAPDLPTSGRQLGREAQAVAGPLGEPFSGQPASSESRAPRAPDGGGAAEAAPGASQPPGAADPPGRSRASFGPDRTADGGGEAEAAPGASRSAWRCRPAAPPAACRTAAARVAPSRPSARRPPAAPGKAGAEGASSARTASRPGRGSCPPGHDAPRHKRRR
ncbi:translation initiation factor IF-2-like [Lagopus muta]|uniref:translation initiation factor IF-2-like n=1 Tax=Lagopus muta TaxID=64668 RepID=UPI00209F1CC5|nr:translation initiation factor IF-2-like [Lagopus muta]